MIHGGTTPATRTYEQSRLGHSLYRHPVILHQQPLHAWYSAGCCALTAAHIDTSATPAQFTSRSPLISQTPTGGEQPADHVGGAIVGGIAHTPLHIDLFLA